MKLHIGSKGAAIPGFKKVDMVQWGDTDYVRDARDLSCFADNTVSEIYASHILEHFHKPETVNVLREWHRVLQPGGIAYISVPDFSRAIELYNKIGYLTDYLQDLIWGGQEYPTAFHYRGFTYPILSGLMSEAGFSKVERIAEMPYGVRDCSKLRDTLDGKSNSIHVRGVK